VTYFSNKGFRNYVSEGCVSEASRGPVPSGESDTWYRVRLPVPSIPPTSKFTNCCKLMDIDYKLNFVVEMVGEPEPLELHLPLVIGTVPLHKKFPYLMTSQALEELGTKTQRMPGAVHVKFSDLRE
ncbi:unnamed protein product, partial [Timema podura]|nr:unnamed protein product [Timema podura]